jgi:hypothetical protein
MYRTSSLRSSTKSVYVGSSYGHDAAEAASDTFLIGARTPMTDITALYCTHLPKVAFSTKLNGPLLSR